MPEEKKKRPTRRVAKKVPVDTTEGTQPEDRLEYEIRAMVIGNDRSGLARGLHFLENGEWDLIPMEELYTTLPDSRNVLPFEEAMDTVMEVQPASYKGGRPVENKPPNQLTVLLIEDEEEGACPLLVNGMELILRREHSVGALTYVCREQAVVTASSPAEWAKVASARISAKVTKGSKRRNSLPETP